MTDSRSAAPLTAPLGARLDQASQGLESQLRAALDAKTKPAGSLGRIESLVVDMGIAQHSLQPTARPAAVAVFAADHGVSEEGVSAFPREVTAQMVANFVDAGAAVAVLGQQFDVTLEVIDVGVDADLSAVPGLIQDKVANGTANLRATSAMTPEQLDAALQCGRRAVQRAVVEGVRVLALGEMGIANTTSAAILTGLMCKASAGQVTGRGTGVADAALDIKRTVVNEALVRLERHVDDPLECLREAGGLELAALVGAMLEAPAHRLVVVVDGFVVTAAALIACRIDPASRLQMIFAHRSAEQGHLRALEALNAQPLLDLELRLGEGSGAVLALPLLDAACTILRDMATFTEAGVSDGA